MVTEDVVLHPVESLTVTVYVPAERPVAVAFVCPPGDHAYVYGITPREAVTVALPVLLHSILVCVIPEILTSAVSPNTKKLVVAEQPIASVTVIVYVPVPNPFTVVVVCPPGAHK